VKHAPFSVPRLTYGITPPKLSTDEDARRKLAAVQSERIAALPVDAVVVYDLQDESSRTEMERPFPFMQAVDPLSYAYEYLEIHKPCIVYRSVAGQTAGSLRTWLDQLHKRGGAAVLVGAPSRSASVNMRLSEAYRLYAELSDPPPLGGVMIAERHDAGALEDGRVFSKWDAGCSYMISQAVYSVTASKNVLSDLHFRALREQRQVPPILVTLSPCGSQKTLSFLRWLGVSVPRWLENELLHAHDILETSVEYCLRGLQELKEFADEKGIWLGCNVESVSVRKAEIDAAVEMVHRAKKILDAS
jgi:hypothetical protein